jgi:hypothetical protein
VPVHCTEEFAPTQSPQKRPPEIWKRLNAKVRQGGDFIHPRPAKIDPSGAGDPILPFARRIARTLNRSGDQPVWNCPLEFHTARGHRLSFYKIVNHRFWSLDFKALNTTGDSSAKAQSVTARSIVRRALGCAGFGSKNGQLGCPVAFALFVPQGNPVA